jgi:hypothetical protein
MVTTLPGLDVGSFGVSTVHATRNASPMPTASASASGRVAVGLPTGSTADHLLLGIVVAAIVLHVAYRRWL